MSKSSSFSWLKVFNLFGFLLILSSTELVHAGHQKTIYEIKSLSGEPNYKSVNLSWEIDTTKEEIKSSTESSNDNISQYDDDNESKQPSFTVFYCEMQTWGPHRCKSKVLTENEVDTSAAHDDRHNEKQHYSMIIDNLRMATKYTFHVKQQLLKSGEMKPSGRAGDLFDDDVDDDGNDLDSNGIIHGQTIIIPTKGFSAHATKCLPHASEIVVETGPYFGGKILAENSNCGIQGDVKNPRDTYTMRIDHEKCGSRVKHEDLTVETFITVQENLGIFTHSTRRFVVVCTYQPETLTVRASFSVPGRGGAVVMSPEWVPETNGRSARERQFKMVGRNALILKENDPDRLEASDFPKHSDEDEHVDRKTKSIQENIIENKNEQQKSDNLKPIFKEVKYSRLVDDRYSVDEFHNSREDKTGRNYTGMVIAVSLSVIMVGTVLYLLQRETKKQSIQHKIRNAADRVQP